MPSRNRKPTVTSSKPKPGSIRYRNSEKREREDTPSTALEEALSLLHVNDSTLLSKTRPRFIRGSVTWARLGDMAATEVAQNLLSVQSTAALDRAVDHAQELGNALGARDAVPGARVTTALRHQITLLVGLTKGLDEVSRIREGKLKPNFENAGRANMLRQRWLRIGGGENVWVSQSIEQATAKVLASSTTAGVKSLWTRALSSWLPQVHLPSTGATRVQWDSDDDD